MDKVIKRDSNFELLRMVSMLFIILHHLMYHGGYRPSQIFNFNSFILTLLESGGKLGVVLFVMITGYYKIKSKDSKFIKLIELELQVLFYSIGIFIVFMLFSNRGFTLKEIPKIFLPNISKVYWFFSSYFILFLFIPFLNRLVDNISKREYIKLLVIGFIFLILIPSVVIYNRYINEGIYLFYYYLLGGYIRLYADDIKSNICYLLGFIIFYLFIVIITMFMGKLSYSNNDLLSYVDVYSKLGSVLILGASICLFIFFKGLKLGCNKIINVIASTTFGVYLFHEHIFMKELLWKSIFSLNKVLNSNNIFIASISIAILIYIFGSFIDLIRQIIFKYFKKIIIKIKLKKSFN